MSNVAAGVPACSCQAAFVFHSTIAIAVLRAGQIIDRNAKTDATIGALRGFSAGSRAIRVAPWRLRPRQRLVPLAPEGRPASTAKLGYLDADSSVWPAAGPSLNRRIDGATTNATTLANGPRSDCRTVTPAASSCLGSRASPASGPCALAN